MQPINANLKINPDSENTVNFFDSLLQPDKTNLAKPLYAFSKRFFDIFCSFTGLLIISPLLLVLSLFVGISSPGPIIYCQKRIGKGGKPFLIYKFRTMYQDSNNLNKYFTPEQYNLFLQNYKLENDPRITKIGAFLRNVSFDELPQLLNILKGDMSIVGPRPITSKELKKYGIYVNSYFSVKPGLTGLWQVSGRSSTTYDERVQMDAEYVRIKSCSVDLKLIFKTFKVVLLRKGAF